MPNPPGVSIAETSGKLEKIMNEDYIINADKSAFPHESAMNAGDSAAGGLTKREYFAAMAMQGMIANPEIVRPIRNGVEFNNFADVAISYADAILKQLEK